jgi:eukaryotic-like serine/threonine-protein kinase
MKNNAPPATPGDATEQWRSAFAWVRAHENAPEAARAQAISALAIENAAVAQVARVILEETQHVQTAAQADSGLEAKLNAASWRAAPLHAGQRVGQYELIAPLGQGGMSDVWRARRSDGLMDAQEFAIKLPTTLLPSPLLVERFHREREILAHLNHPNIAKIYDAGVMPAGQPFLALEFVPGMPIDEYAKSKRLTLRMRIQLVIQTAHALHHAHTRLVLHRDVKPGNMLVDADGNLKLLDFGIGKLLAEQNADADAELTRLTGTALTIKYAAPEQILEEPITTAADIFSLGVVLFELVSGALPFGSETLDRRARFASLNETARQLADVTLSDESLAQRKLRSQSQHQKQVSGDLQAIVSKALRRVPADRYSSALAFASDLQRFLDHRPVAARKGAWTYFALRFSQRHRAALAVASVGALVLASVGFQALKQQRTAERAQADAKLVQRLFGTMFAGMSPDVASSQTFTAKQLLDRATGYLDQQPQLSPKNAVELDNAIASLYRDIGDHPAAIVRFERNLTAAVAQRDLEGQLLARISIADNANKGDLMDRAKAEIDLANALLPSAIKRPHQVFAHLKNVEGSYFLHTYAPKEAQETYLQAIAELKALNSQDVDQWVWATEGQAQAARALGDNKRARALYAEAIEMDARWPTRVEVDRLRTQSQLASIDQFEGRFRAAASVMEPICTRYLAQLGAKAHETQATCNSVATALIRLGRVDESEQLLKRLQPTGSSTMLAEPKRIYALIANAKGKPSEAEAIVAETLATLSREKHVSTNYRLRMERLHAECVLRQGRATAAEAMFDALIAKQIPVFGAESVDIALVRTLRGIARLQQGKSTHAKEDFSFSHAVFVKRRSEDFQQTHVVAGYLALLEPTEMEKRAEIARWLEAELGWQNGVSVIANQLRKKGGNAEFLRTVPVIF